MSLAQLTNLQAELAIITESIQLFESINYFPSTYSDLVTRYNEILGVYNGIFTSQH
jgi:hypothetical protein